MKYFIIVVSLFFFFSSCSKDNEKKTTQFDYHGKWTLVKMTGSMINSETSGSALEWQELYVFNEDGKFTRSRTRNTILTTVSGTYTTENNENVIHLILTYSNENELIGTCTGDLKEDLYFSDKNTLSNTWQMCDGPKLDYQKIN